MLKIVSTVGAISGNEAGDSIFMPLLTRAPEAINTLNTSARDSKGIRLRCHGRCHACF